MRIVFTIEVGVDVPSYVQAGEILDRLKRDIEEAIGPKGEYDIANFRARHKHIRDYAEPMMMGADQALPDPPVGLS
jgi:hypothetical protein